MSFAETEIANVESIRAPERGRFGKTPIQQFARAGLDLKIGEFRQICEELEHKGLLAGDTAHDIADVLFDWMTAKLEPDGS